MIDGLDELLESGWEVWRNTPTEDDYGGLVEGFALHLTLSGRLRPLSGEFRLSADKDTAFATHRFYCAVTDIQAGDELRNDEARYTVVFPADVMTMGELMQVDLREVERGE